MASKQGLRIFPVVPVFSAIILILLIVKKYINQDYYFLATDKECMRRIPAGLLADKQEQSGQRSALNLEERYLNHTSSIDGWMSPVHHKIVKYLSDEQFKLGIRGLIGEIGVHHGKFFFSLATNLDSSEYAVAFDVFEDQQYNVDGSGKGSLKKFMKHAKAIGFPKHSIKIEKGDSNLITQERLKDLSWFSYRMFSVDGGHTRETTINDLFLAESVLHKKGFVILDDFINSDWLGVLDGFSVYTNRCNSDLRPFLWLNNKLYLASKSQHAMYLNIVENMPMIKCTSSTSMHISRYSIKGFSVCVARETS